MFWRYTQHVNGSIWTQNFFPELKDLRQTVNTWKCLKANLKLSVGISSAPTHTRSCRSYLQDARMPMGRGAGEEDRTECRCSKMQKKKLSLHPQRKKNNYEWNQGKIKGPRGKDEKKAKG